MQINNDTISFKSLPDLFMDEMHGLKANTVRVLAHNEAEQVNDMWGCLEKIKISNSVSGEAFIRELTNITDITDVLKIPFQKNERLFVFSWLVK